MQINKQICFLVGVPRSGTTWMQRLLQSHPKICGGAESYFLSFFAHPLRESHQMIDQDYKIGPLTYIDHERLENAIRSLWFEIFGDLYAASPTAEVHLEKTPHHSLFLRDAMRLFPTAKVIFLSRDSRAVVSSMIHASKTWGQHWAPRTYKQAASMWWQYTSAFTNWRRDNPDHSSLLIRYEDALADTEGALRTILEFLLGSCSDGEIADTLNTFQRQALKTEEPEGFARIRGEEGWKTDLSLYGRLITWRYTRKKMRELGYDIAPFG